MKMLSLVSSVQIVTSLAIMRKACLASKLTYTHNVALNNFVCAKWVAEAEYKVISNQRQLL